jgi:thiamine-monophosphate kinase
MADAAHNGSGEDRLIARFFQPLASDPAALGLGDDVACLTPAPGTDLVLTTDTLVGGIHFFVDDPANTVARKAMRVNLSDVAAKGARPLGFLLSLAVPEGIADAWFADFADGLKADIGQFQCPLFGGDTVRTGGPMVITVAMFASVAQGTMVRRSGAKSGDRIFVTGTIGDAALGLSMQKDNRDWPLTVDDRAYLIARYRLPQPRMAAAEAVRRFASSAMDISDGLAGDLSKLCRASGVSARIEIGHVPRSVAADVALAFDSLLLETMLTGGDDYEILSTVAADRSGLFKAEAAAAGVPVTDIGEIVPGQHVPQFFATDGKPVMFARLSYSHF